ncbi:MAG TPA: hypothetical protein VIM71_11810 [Lacunisphaera sp.]
MVSLAMLGLVFSGGCASVPTPPKPPVITIGQGSKVEPGDPGWAQFSDYLNQLAASIQQRWYRILEESHIVPVRGSQVVIRFKLNAGGDTEIVDVTDHGSGKLGVRAAIAALDGSGPHPTWTESMIATLGNEQTLTFSFAYQ